MLVVHTISDILYEDTSRRTLQGRKTDQYPSGLGNPIQKPFGIST